MDTHTTTLQGPPHVHHMDSKTAYESAKFGMWLFLATELLLFGVLFAAFFLYRWKYLSEFEHAALQLDWKFGSINTAVLLFSSFTAALAVFYAQHNDNAKVRLNVLITIGCGFIFLIIKAIEYYAKYKHGYFIGTEHFNNADMIQKYKVYFGLYFCMTMLHALHVVIGMSLLFWVYTKARVNRFSEAYFTPVEIAALYWHLVDLIWIYLFPLLYLVK